MTAAGSRRATARTSTSAIGDVVSAKCAVSGRPVRKNTSSARTIRFKSRGWIRSGRLAIDASEHAVQERRRPRRSAIDVEPLRAARRRFPAPETGPGSARGSRSQSRRRRTAARRARASHGSPRRVPRILGRRVLVGRIGDVDEVMRDAAPVGQRHLVGADVEPAIDRRRIAVDDLAPMVARPGRARARSSPSPSGRGWRRRAAWPSLSRGTNWSQPRSRKSTYAMKMNRRISRPRCWTRVGGMRNYRSRFSVSVLGSCSGSVPVRSSEFGLSERQRMHYCGDSL